MIKAVWDSKASGNFESDFDSFIAESLLLEGKSVGNLEDALIRYKVSTLPELADKQKEKLKEYPKLEKLFYEIEMPLAKVLWKMQEKGILLDTKQLSKVGQNIDSLLVSVKEEIAKDTGGGININSPMQLGNFLVDKN